MTLSLMQQIKNRIKPSSKITAYGTVIVPDGRVLLKRLLIETGPESKRTTRPGLWHTTVRKCVSPTQHIYTNLKSALYSDLHINPEIHKLNIKHINTKDFNSSVFGQIILYIIRLEESIKFTLPLSIDYKLMFPEDLCKDMETNSKNYMSDALAAMEILRENWKGAFS